MAVRVAAAKSGAHNGMLPVLGDVAVALAMVAKADRRRFLRCFVSVPVGVFATMAACFGVDRLFSLGGVAFPASVACLVLLFLALLFCDRVIGETRTKYLVRYINISGGWSLRWLNLFFTPAFVMLPLSPRISAAEVGKIIGVFVVGFIVMMIFTAYMTRAIQLVLSPPRKALHQRAEELQRESMDMVLLRASEASRISGVPETTEMTKTTETSGPPTAPPRSHTAAYITIRGQNLDDPLSSFSDVPVQPVQVVARQHPSPKQQKQQQQQFRRLRVERWAEWVGAHIDACMYATVLLTVGLPVYYATGYAMPLQLCINVLMYLGAMGLPAAWRQVLHPVLVSAFSTLLVIWLLGRVRGNGLPETLDEYRRGMTYLKLWASAASSSPKGPSHYPGAGDVLGSVLDVSIVSLALPMYQYRRELQHHFVAIIVPNIVLSVTSLFAYPIICHHVGISPERSLAFTSRSLTLALATPAVRNLGGDLNTVAAVALISGILGVLIGRQLLSWLRIPEDDYVSRGVAFGANASALGTALLLRTDPRAAALSSLAMSLFGTVTVAFSSVPPMVHIIRGLVGLS